MSSTQFRGPRPAKWQGWAAFCSITLLAGGATHSLWLPRITMAGDSLRETPKPAAQRPAAKDKSQATDRTRVSGKSKAGATKSPKKTAKTAKKAATSPVAYRKIIVRGVPMHVVQVDPRNPNVRLGVVTPKYGIGARESWSDLVDRARPAAAITGTYFCTSSGIPVGSIIAAGRTVHRGGIGTAFTFSPAKGAQVVTCLPNRGYDWKGADTVLRAGPRLLTAGQRTLWPEAEGFKDPAVYQRKRRTAVAVTKHGKLLLVAVNKPVLLRTLADSLRDLGAVDAMCLDGGGSTGLYTRGKTQIKPDRPLTNLLVVYDSPARYAQQVGRLNPTDTQIVRLEASPSG